MQSLTLGKESFKKSERVLVFAILLYLILQGSFGYLERRFFWGEIFVLFIFFFIKKFRLPSNGMERQILFLVLVWTLFFPVYGWAIGQYHLLGPFIDIYFVRHLVFFYYCVFFFLAYKYAYLFVYYLGKLAIPLIIFIPFASFILGRNGMAFPPLCGLMLMGVSQRFESAKAYNWALLLVFLLLLGGSPGGTGKFLILFFTGFVLINWVMQWPRQNMPRLYRIAPRILMIFGLIIVIYTLYYLLILYNLTTELALLGSTINIYQSLAEKLHTDLNGIWRPVLWSHLLGRFLEHPWGVGLGTPLFENWLDGFVALHLYKEGENYVQGAHNSFITIITRLGIPALILLSTIFFTLTKMVGKFLSRLQYLPFRHKGGRLLSGCLIAFVFGGICASFNVVLESPLYAAMFWSTFGLLVRLFGDFLDQKVLGENLS